MTGFEPDDRVHVQFDGASRSFRRDGDGGQELIVAPDGGWFPIAVPVTFCTLIRPPLRVGDVLTADDPEPPAETVVRTTRGGVFVRDWNTWLQPGTSLIWAWRDVATGEPLIVLYVPEDQS